MAKSPSHKLGQYIGDFVESVILPLLENFCQSHGNDNLYLDKNGKRFARRGKKLIWQDKYQNKHVLDYVIERGGTPDKIGHPVAFIESAWRRYAKHSKNKAQEIQGAIAPIAEKYAWDTPFKGAFLAGVFTDPALTQMKSEGFIISMFAYKSIVDAFLSIGVDISFDETTTDELFIEKLNKIQSLSKEEIEQAKLNLLNLNKYEIDNFFKNLAMAITKKITCLQFIPLFGHTYEFNTLKKLADFIHTYDFKESQLEYLKCEIYVRYTNGSEIRSYFCDKAEIFSFLEYISHSIQA